MEHDGWCASGAPWWRVRDDGGVAIDRGDVGRSSAAAVFCVLVRAGVEQQVDDVVVLIPGSHHERRRPILGLRVYLRIRVDQQFDHLRVAVLGGGD